MTDESPAEGAAPPKPMSVGRRVLWGALLVAVGVGGFVGAQALLHAIDDPPAIVAEQPSQGQREIFTSIDDGFSVAFPSEPTVERTVQQVGEYRILISVYTSLSDAQQFVVSTAEMPAAVIEQKSDSVLTNMLTGAADGAGAELLAQSFITVGGERAITGVMTVTGQTVYVTIALYGTRQYSISVLTHSAEAAATFRDSFTFD